MLWRKMKRVSPQGTRGLAYGHTRNLVRTEQASVMHINAAINCE